MEQSRSDSTGSQQQNVHLHMHHICACQSIYPTTFYPPITYRNPLVPYATAQGVSRPYLQHYQYTQFNVGSQYSMPMTPLTSGYPSTTSHQGVEAVVALPTRDRRERTSSQDGGELERIPTDLPEFEFAPGPVMPPVNELFFNSDDCQMNTDSFIKFLERSCITAEQIAYRNRNRPCFRNIQNLCIRTRSEILKPRTTISNIHSQGIPWATKDFIYAFVRLTNCWHILKGYWENREGSALGKIEKELTPGFKACYVRWEKETVELATELTRIFYNLDINQSNPGPGVHPHIVASPQVNILKPAPNEATKKVVIPENANVSVPCSKKNTRGLLHLPSGVSETVDQGNQTCSGDFCAKSDDTEEDNGTVYMKPGSYRVPKKYKSRAMSLSVNNSSSPRVIEFLDTAQNVTKGLEAANDKYWVKVTASTAKKIEQRDDVAESECNSEVFVNIHDWLSNSNFSDYGEPSSGSCSPPKLHAYTDAFDDTSSNLGPDTIPSRTYRRKAETLNIMVYEIKSGGLTKKAKSILDKILFELKSTELAGLLTESVVDGPNLNMIQNNFTRGCYNYVNEFVRDLKYFINTVRHHFQTCETSLDKLKQFIKKLDTLLEEYFSNYDFTAIKGIRGEKVGKLKLKNFLFNGDGDHAKN